MKKINGLICCIFTAIIALAPNTYAFKRTPLFLSIDPALLLAKPGVTQAINLYNDMGNTYVNQSGWQQQGTVVLGAGLRAYQNEQVQVNSSFRYIPVSNLSLTGDIWQLNSPLFNDLAYKFQTRSDLFLVDNIISWSRYRLQPGIILGAGVSRNTTSALIEIPLVKTSAPSLQQALGSKNTPFAYEFGAALDYTMDRCLFELAYRYINAGQGYLQPFPLQNTLDRLSTGTLQYHVISLGIRAYYEI
ncbi:MAG: hypothetical protein NTW08_09165 [Gammaproteobacteria bacterium]|nr:hypothetical protein [Gammaproteobacteria bacterium]